MRAAGDPRALWRQSNVWRLAASTATSQIGTQVTFLGLPFIAIRLLHATPFEVGAINALDFAPFVVFGAVAGIVADRADRRRLLLVADAGRAVIMLTVPLLYAVYHLALWELLVVAVLASTLGTLFDSAWHSYVPDLVPRSQLPEANALLEFAGAGSRIAGAGLAGLIIAIIGAPLAIVADAASYTVSFISILGMRASPLYSQGRGKANIKGGSETAAESWVAMTREGLRFVSRHKWLRGIATSSAIGGLAIAITEAVFLVYFVRDLRLSAAEVGLALMVGNAGLALSTTLVQRFMRILGYGWVLITGAGLSATGLILIPLARHSDALVILIASQATRTFGIVMYNVVQVTIRQLVTPPEMLGRVNGLMRAMSWALIPVGALGGGALATVIGVRVALEVAGAIAVTAITPLVLSQFYSFGEMAGSEA